MVLPEVPDTEKGLAEGTILAIYLQGTTSYYKILHRDTIFYTDAHAALASGGTETYANVTNLNPPTDQVYQFYNIDIDGNVRVFLRQPAATHRWGTNLSPAGGYLTQRDDDQIVNIWTLQDYPPAIQIVNPTNATVTPTLKWYGWRYGIEKIAEERNGRLSYGTSKPPVYTQITLGGISK